MDTKARTVIKIVRPSRVKRRLERAGSRSVFLIVDLLCGQVGKRGGLDRAGTGGRAHILVTVVPDSVGALAVVPGGCVPREEAAVAVGCPVAAELEAPGGSRPDLDG